MIVKLSLLDGKRLKNNYTIPCIFEGKGEYALEIVIATAIEVYYGSLSKTQLEDILKIRLSDELISKSLDVYLERKK